MVKRSPLRQRCALPPLPQAGEVKCSQTPQAGNVNDFTSPACGRGRTHGVQVRACAYTFVEAQ
jgi:hypothetical protein